MRLLQMMSFPMAGDCWAAIYEISVWKMAFDVDAYWTYVADGHFISDKV